jgi:hypothetical protein
VLAGEDARAELVAALEGVTRLVLLGDVLELRRGPIRQALAAAEPVLRRLGGALGPDGEVVIVPGNHDHQLLAPWIARRALQAHPVPLGLESVVDWLPEEPLGQLAEWLAPARMQVAYPGVWLREDVYATHGHYGDRHTTVPMFERLGAGAMARIVGEPAGGPASAEDYEAVLAPMYAWIYGVAQRRGGAVGRSSHGPSTRAWRALNGTSRRGGARAWARRQALRLGIPAAIAAVNRAGLGPVRPDLSTAELRRAGLRGVAEALTRMGVDRGHVVFGHTHRAGPLAADDPVEWALGGAGRLINCGSWVHEPAYLGSRPSTSPYRAGFGVRVPAFGEPELANLLDGLNARARA